MPTPNMSLTLPIPNVTSGTWGTILNTALTSIDLHDHTTGRGVPLTSASINSTGGFTLNGMLDSTVPGNFPAINLIGGNGGATKGAHIRWTTPSAPTEIMMLESPVNGQLFLRQLQGIVDTGGTMGLSTTDGSVRAVLDSDPAGGPAAAQLILRTPDAEVRLRSFGGEAVLDGTHTSAKLWVGASYLAIADGSLSYFNGATTQSLLLPTDVAAYDTMFSFAGAPTADKVMAQVILVRASTLAINSAGSKGVVGVNPTSPATILVKKNGATVVTISVTVGGVFSFANAGVVTFAAGDVVTLVAQTVPDATMADISITLAGALA
jgi:hypothetical protein